MTESIDKQYVVELNEPLEQYVIPKDTTSLVFSNEFNQELEEGVIPNSVTHIYFGNNFNQKIKKDVFSNNIIYIKFGDNFNQSLETGFIPNSIIDIELSTNSKIRFNSVTRAILLVKKDQDPSKEILESRVICVFCYKESKYKDLCFLSEENGNDALCAECNIDCIAWFDKIQEDTDNKKMKFIKKFHEINFGRI